MRRGFPSMPELDVCAGRATCQEAQGLKAGRCQGMEGFFLGCSAGEYHPSDPWSAMVHTSIVINGHPMLT